jgi:heptosyltransferase-2
MIPSLTRVLVVRPDGIGDEILSLPVATALRRMLPRARVSFLSTGYAAPVLQHHPDVDEVLTVTGRESFAELVALFRRGFDAAVFVKPFRRLMIAAWAARVPLRVATGYRWYSVFANRRVYQHRSDFAKHESEYNVGLLAGLGLPPTPVTPPRLVLTATERTWGTERLAAIPAPRIVLHPGGFAARTWRGEHYWSLAGRLAGQGYGVVLTGTAAEAERFYSEAARRVVTERGLLDLMGHLDVRQLMAVIAASQGVVSGATGPAHMAAALGVPTVSLFDPRRNNLPVRWGPLGRGFVLRPDVPTCETCIHEACPYWDCLDRITVEQVAYRIRDIIDAPAPLAVLHV